tara:strand:+ start:661 stop:918 length:258 start_codon:yes stop_codon:yes gene_type:complete
MKEGLTLKKKSDGADEFLVEKKNPLVLPPEFNELPAPQGNEKKQETISSSKIQELLNKNGSTVSTSSAGSNSNEVERNILEKIKN